MLSQLYTGHMEQPAHRLISTFHASACFQQKVKPLSLAAFFFTGSSIGEDPADLLAGETLLSQAAAFQNTDVKSHHTKEH